jgi:hypothetical protein
MDVHKDSIRLAVLQGNDRDTVYEGSFENDVPKVIRRLKSFVKKGLPKPETAICASYWLSRAGTIVTGLLRMPH